jgi:hypothetical protein
MLPAEQLFKEEDMKTKFTFNFLDGATFLQDESLSLEEVVSIIHILAEFVRREDPPPAAQTKKRLDVIRKIMPSIITAIAEGSRKDSGERLLRRSMRHALDPQNPPLVGGEGGVVTIGEEVGLRLKTNIRASMKNQAYIVELIVTATELKATHCTCKAGGCRKDRVACVHSAVVLLLLTILLYDGLADHILYELATIWKNEPAFANPAQKEKAASAIKALMRVTNRSKIADGDYDKVNELLESFIVGTERPKLGQRLLPADRLGPMRNHAFVSDTDRMKKKQEEAENKATVPTIAVPAATSAGEEDEPAAEASTGEEDEPAAEAMEPNYVAIKAMIASVKPALVALKMEGPTMRRAGLLSHQVASILTVALASTSY